MYEDIQDHRGIETGKKQTQSQCGGFKSLKQLCFGNNLSVTFLVCRVTKHMDSSFKANKNHRLLSLHK